MPADSGFLFPTSTPTPRKFCFARRSFDCYKNTTFSPTNASKFFVHGAGAALASIMISTFIPPIPKHLKPFLAISSAAPCPFKDSIRTRRVTTSSISPNQETDKPSSSTRSTSSHACSSTFPSLAFNLVLRPLRPTNKKTYAKETTQCRRQRAQRHPA